MLANVAGNVVRRVRACISAVGGQFEHSLYDYHAFSLYCSVLILYKFFLLWVGFYLDHTIIKNLGNLGTPNTETLNR